MNLLINLLEVTILLAFTTSQNVSDTCSIKKNSCAEAKCELQTTIYSIDRINSIAWFRDNMEIKVQSSQYTGFMNETRMYCKSDKPCIKTIIGLEMKPFLPKDYGMYMAFLTTEGGTEIRCKSKIILKQVNNMSNGSGESNVTVKTNYVYIVIGVLTGCVLLILILVAVVIHLARANRKKPVAGTAPTVSTIEQAERQDRKFSNGPSNHTYASVSSENFRYESLMGRRGTRDGYEVPASQMIPEDSPSYLDPARNVSTSIKRESEDDSFSDFSITMDSAFSSSISSLAGEEAMNNPQYSTDVTNAQNVHFCNGEYQTVPCAGDKKPREQSRKAALNTDYQNIKKTRRLT